MKKALTTLVAVVALSVVASGQNINLLSLGTSGFTLDAGSPLQPPQTATSITLNGTYAFGDTFYGDLISAPADWSAYTNFSDLGVVMSVTGANPNLTFTIALYDSSFDLINSYLASTAGLTSTPSVAWFNSIATPGNLKLNDVNYLQFTWGLSGTINTTMNEVVAVPEPSTYALLALSALGFGGYVVRRRRRA